MERISIRIGLITCILFGSLFFGGAALAQDEELPEPGLLPDSPFYFFDKLGKSIGMLLTFGDESKAAKALEYAGERLAEARAMVKKNRLEKMEQAADDYDGFMEQVRTRLEATIAGGVSDNISERVALAAGRHLAVLDELLDEVPEEAAGAIERARNASMNGQVNALRALVRTRVERAIDINSDAIRGQIERALGKASANATGAVAGNLDFADRLLQLEDELTGLAEEQGIDLTAVRQRLTRSTAKRLDVLSGVYERVPENARPAIARAIENSFEKFERALEQLRERNAEGDAPDEDEVLARVSNEIRERLRPTPSHGQRRPDDEDSTSGNLTRPANKPQNGAEHPEEPGERGTTQHNP